ncbi:ATP-binding protein [Streptomyces sp. NBC_01264]|uniref:ATP-binding protein n=1 Tax=Streptomyces sp. NBC_01264 TaxID=2903804 RepID=UPI00225A2D59|nr:ATP-binding protein [Streptomyces sp. NBC_01264]MCX4779543.1 ATP-binding protein [Streptomyces sp. NBC_01264]
MSIWWSLHLRREAASVPLARRLLLGTMETAGVDPDISFDLSVALSEACANAVEHGGREAVPRSGCPDDAAWDAASDDASGGSPDGTGAYHVTAYLDGDRCRIEVSDSGPGFPAATVARRRPSLAEHGRGLHLIEELADHVRFRNRPGRGAVVSFDKMLKWRDDSLLKVS